MGVPTLRKLVVRGFRSIAAQDIVLDNPTFLVGRNGAGKSNVADVFSFLADAMDRPLTTVFDQRGGFSAVRTVRSQDADPQSDELVVTAELANIDPPLGYMGFATATYGFVLQPLKDNGFKVVRENCTVEREDGSVGGFDRTEEDFKTNLYARAPDEPVETAHGWRLAPFLESDALALPLVSGHNELRALHRFLSAMRVYKIDPHVLREMQSPDEGRRLLPHGGNVSSVLRYLQKHSPQDLENVRDLLATIVPNMTDVRAQAFGNKLALEFTQAWNDSQQVTFDASSVSDGALRALGLIAAVHQRPKPSVVVLEEPELTMHPNAMGVMLDLLENASRTMQVVVTTHSGDILDARWIEDRHLRIVEWAGGQTRVSPASDASRRILTEGMMSAGDMLRCNALRAASPQQYPTT